MEKPFIYLMQGQAQLVAGHRALGRRGLADAIFLTYDEPLDGAVYFPNSTWAEGRNRLLQEVWARGRTYEYYIFCDDDVTFEQGSWDTFEQNLLRKRPGIGVPLFEKTRNSPLPFPRLTAQPFFINDEQLIAFHHQVVADNLVLPYQTGFDHVNWWISCEIQQLLIQNFYPGDCLQFNDVMVLNVCTKRYNAHYEHDASFREVVGGWMGEQFRGPYRKTSYYVPLRLHRLVLRTLLYKIRRLINADYSVATEAPARLLNQSSELLKQYNAKTQVS